MAVSVKFYCFLLGSTKVRITSLYGLWVVLKRKRIRADYLFGERRKNNFSGKQCHDLFCYKRPVKAVLILIAKKSKPKY